MSEQAEFMARTLLGDLDGALEVARLLEDRGEVFEMDLLFIPETTPLRQHPGFADLTVSLGLDEYWSKSGCEWIDSRLRCRAD